MISHAPTALLAARAMGLPAVLTCTGFEVPPSVEPLPSIRPWADILPERLQLADIFVLERLNGVLGHYGQPAFERMADPFDGVPTLFTTFAELDHHYGARAAGEYVGMFSSVGDGGEHRTSPEASSARVFAYLRPTVPGFENMLEGSSTARGRCLTRCWLACRC